MPVKKKKSMAKSVDKRNVPGASLPDDSKNGQTVGRAAAAGDEAEAPPDPRARQMTAFEDGMRLFHARQFQRAREFFETARQGPDRTVAHRAGLHARMCERRLEAPAVVLKTPEEHYNYAVTLMNSRDFAGAQQHLRAALEAEPNADHVVYALAACQSLAGDVQGAYENLKRAIDLQPRNRIAARQDPDFGSVADHQAFARLLYPDRKN